jgi:HTH-type transcriptional regulator, competence development regulator
VSNAPGRAAFTRADSSPPQCFPPFAFTAQQTTIDRCPPQGCREAQPDVRIEEARDGRGHARFICCPTLDVLASVQYEGNTYKISHTDTRLGNKQFGEFVRNLRETKKRTDAAFSLRRFAAAIEVSPTFLSRMETGEFDPPGPDKIVKMAELLGIERFELLALAEKADPELTDLVSRPSRGMAQFLRTANEERYSDDEYKQALEILRQQRQNKGQ